MVTILFSASDESWEKYRAPLETAFDAVGLDVTLSTRHDPETVEYIVYAPSSGLVDFSAFTRLKAVLNLWAGVEAVTGNPTLNVPLARMVDPGLTSGMVEYVTGHVLRHHLGIDDHIHNQDGVWRPEAPPLAQDRRVGILGIGALGAACATTLAGLGFDVAGWSRSQKTIDGITTLSGTEGLHAILARSDILVLLLPLTEATRGVIDGHALDRMPPGAVIINPGRGPLIVDSALISALETGQIAHATLDVFATEPLPRDHPFWSHPGVTVTPHIASSTRPPTAATVIAENVRRGEAGEPFLHLVDRDAGY
ncbi:glyoxylate/hydroxypyruvate reductase A [Palleronia aestuarii]|uniref:Glyoxylate/hydroxypyruvate reductase A n=1 Tax=Palleronia aestuarii TaxID=568105 RepID=A0A2W7NDE4_9RHOB|nr:glyoxylate/hydroxypyruvate reductase A [Palleronia aestuarii]PZX18421.1 glyoxylate/hydroxypyruvate reductase A [Palleronia aestuarii]